MGTGAAERFDTDGMILTIQQHIFEQQREFYPDATGEFSWLLSGMTLATKMIEGKVRRAGLNNILGAAGETNVQGEVQQKLDVFANRALLHCLGNRGSVRVLASEENEVPVVLHRSKSQAKYCVVFDPLDGSSNIDVNVSVGTIFAILRCPEEPKEGQVDDGAADVLQPGYQQIAAGYVLYGSSTVFVYSVGSGVHMFTLDPEIGAYVLSKENLRIPEQGMYYSVNEAYAASFPNAYRVYLEGLRSGHLNGVRYASRYIGSLVADFHRTLLRGGVFLYPPTSTHAKGKLRLLYEANPIAFLAEQAGGMATDGTRRILEIEPTSIHQRTPLIVGGKVEMTGFAAAMAQRD